MRKFITLLAAVSVVFAMGASVFAGTNTASPSKRIKAETDNPNIEVIVEDIRMDRTNDDSLRSAVAGYDYGSLEVCNVRLRDKKTKEDITENKTSYPIEIRFSFDYSSEVIGILSERQNGTAWDSLDVSINDDGQACAKFKHLSPVAFMIKPTLIPIMPADDAKTSPLTSPVLSANAIDQNGSASINIICILLATIAEASFIRVLFIIGKLVVNKRSE